MKGPQILNLPPPFSPVPNSHPPKSPETDPILPGPLLSILPARPLHKKAQNECPCFIFCSFRHLIIPPPPRTPTLFRSPQARDNMHRITTTASHNKNGKPKTAIPTNQPANGKPKCPMNRECMPRQPPSPPPPAKKPNADPQPTDYIPRLKKNKNNKLVLPTPTHPLHLAPASFPRKYFSPPPDPPFHQRQPRDYGPGGVVGIGLLVLPWRRKLLIVD